MISLQSSLPRLGPRDGNGYLFLSRGIPAYEEFFNVDTLLGKENMLFVGVPLNIENGDGMIVRPVVLVY